MSEPRVDVQVAKEQMKLPEVDIRYNDMLNDDYEELLYTYLKNPGNKEMDPATVNGLGSMVMEACARYGDVSILEFGNGDFITNDNVTYKSTNLRDYRAYWCYCRPGEAEEWNKGYISATINKIIFDAESGTAHITVEKMMVDTVDGVDVADGTTKVTATYRFTIPADKWARCVADVKKRIEDERAEAERAHKEKEHERKFVAWALPLTDGEPVPFTETPHEWQEFLDMKSGEKITVYQDVVDGSKRLHVVVWDHEYIVNMVDFKIE